MTKLPNFLIVGAAKSGTTSLFYYLKEHPEIFLGDKKELRFLSSMPGNFKGPGDDLLNMTIIRSFSDYKKYFQAVKIEKAVGDISPDYLYYYESSILNAKKHLNDPKIIIVLRNPIDRAYSQYLHFVRDGRELLSFEEAIEASKKRKEENWEWAWQYIEIGFYYNQVKAYLENFTAVKIYLYDDLRKDALSLIRDIYEFLEVDTSFIPDLSRKYNVSGIPQNKLLHNFLTKPNVLKNVLKPLIKIFMTEENKRRFVDGIRTRNLKKPEMKIETREYLKNVYREDILKLQTLINKDLSHWLK